MHTTVDENGHTENMFKASFALYTLLTNQAKWPSSSKAVDESCHRDNTVKVRLALSAFLTNPANGQLRQWSLTNMATKTHGQGISFSLRTLDEPGQMA